MPTKIEKDTYTGMETTGHEWDGIQELNRPLPKWWIYILYATILWSIAYYVLYPAIPWTSGHTDGVLGYNSREEVAELIVEARNAQAGFRDRIDAAALDEIRADQGLFDFAMAGGRAAFADNCAPCHGTGAAGAKSYPSLVDDDWLWGGSADDVHHTILYGIRADNDETRVNEMPAFVKDEMLSAAETGDVTEYVLSLGGRGEDAEAAARGATVFAEQCTACHGEDGTGIAELGAPNLTDAIWLYGGERVDIVQSIGNGRAGMMPAWVDRLDAPTVKMLAIYVHALGGGQ
jgi:cytochrome c oxidase cbb3-type subunit 3